MGQSSSKDGLKILWIGNESTNQNLMKKLQCRTKKPETDIGKRLLAFAEISWKVRLC